MLIRETNFIIRKAINRMESTAYQTALESHCVAMQLNNKIQGDFFICPT